MGEVNVNSLDVNAKIYQIDHHPFRLKIWRQLLFTKQLKLSFKKQDIPMRNHRRQTLEWKAALLFTICSFPIIWFFFQKFQYFRLKKIKMKN